MTSCCSSSSISSSADGIPTTTARVTVDYGRLKINEFIASDDCSRCGGIIFLCISMAFSQRNIVHESLILLSVRANSSSSSFSQQKIVDYADESVSSFIILSRHSEEKARRMKRPILHSDSSIQKLAHLPLQ